MVKEITCIICPKSCKIKIDEDHKILNSNSCCSRGKKYALRELTDPRRIFTSTAVVNQGEVKRVPVRSSEPIRKEAWKDAVAIVNNLKLEAPIGFKEVLVEDFLEKGIKLISTRNISRKE